MMQMQAVNDRHHAAITTWNMLHEKRKPDHIGITLKVIIYVLYHQTNCKVKNIAFYFNRNFAQYCP